MGDTSAWNNHFRLCLLTGRSCQIPEKTTKELSLTLGKQHIPSIVVSLYVEPSGKSDLWISVRSVLYDSCTNHIPAESYRSDLNLKLLVFKGGMIGYQENCSYEVTSATKETSRIHPRVRPGLEHRNWSTERPGYCLVINPKGVMLYNGVQVVVLQDIEVISHLIDKSGSYVGIEC